MKITILAIVLILAIAAGLSWQNQQQLDRARDSQATLIAQAAKLGISLDPSDNAHPAIITKHEREGTEVDTKLAAAEFVSFAKQMEEMEKQGKSPDKATQKRMMELLNRMMSLNSSQLKALITEFRDNKDIEEGTRQQLIGFSLTTLAEHHPQAALELFTETSGFFKDKSMARQIVDSSLAKWAKDDPSAAMEWFKTNSGKFPDLVSPDTMSGLVSAAAAQDPKLAFKLISESGLKDSDQMISVMMRDAKTPEQRTSTLVALREYLASLTDDNVRKSASSGAIYALATSVSQDGFESASKWVASAQLSTEELQYFADGLHDIYAKSGDTGKWIEWIGQSLPADKCENQIRSIVLNWTADDYQAVGKWLANAPDSPAKNISIRRYAESVSQYEPEAAAQWALTLPPGKDRYATLRQIYENWPKEDPAAKAAAEAFRTKNGIR